jgi:hypothetical protein
MSCIFPELAKLVGKIVGPAYLGHTSHTGSFLSGSAIANGSFTGATSLSITTLSTKTPSIKDF